MVWEVPSVCVTPERTSRTQLLFQLPATVIARVESVLMKAGELGSSGGSFSSGTG